MVEYSDQFEQDSSAVEESAARPAEKASKSQRHIPLCAKAHTEDKLQEPNHAGPSNSTPTKTNLDRRLTAPEKKLKEEDQTENESSNQDSRAVMRKIKVPRSVKTSNSIVLSKRDISIRTPSDKDRKDVSINIRDAIRAAKDLIQKSAALKREIAKNANQELSPKIKDFQKAVAQAVISVEESSVQDSSLRNDFNEYREILQSHTEHYSDDEFATSMVESMNVSLGQIVTDQRTSTIREEIAAEDRVTPLPPEITPIPPELSSEESLEKLKDPMTVGKKANPQEKESITGEKESEPIVDQAKPFNMVEDVVVEQSELSQAASLTEEDLLRIKNEVPDYLQLDAHLGGGNQDQLTLPTTAESTLKDAPLSKDEKVENNINIVVEGKTNQPSQRQSKQVSPSGRKKPTVTLKPSAKRPSPLKVQKNVSPQKKQTSGQRNKNQPPPPAKTERTKVVPNLVPSQKTPSHFSSFLNKAMIEATKQTSSSKPSPKGALQKQTPRANENKAQPHKPLFTNRAQRVIHQSQSQPGGVLAQKEASNLNLAKAGSTSVKQVKRPEEQPYASVGAKRPKRKVPKNAPGDGPQDDKQLIQSQGIRELSVSRNSSVQSRGAGGQVNQRHLTEAQKSSQRLNKLNCVTKDISSRKASENLKSREAEQIKPFHGNGNNKKATEKRERRNTKPKKCFEQSAEVPQSLPKNKLGNQNISNPPDKASQKENGIQQYEVREARLQSSTMPKKREETHQSTKSLSFDKSFMTSDYSDEDEDYSPVIRQRLKQLVQRKASCDTNAPNDSLNVKKKNRRSLKKPHLKDPVILDDDSTVDLDFPILAGSTGDIETNQSKKKHSTSKLKDFIKNTTRDQENRVAKVKGKLKNREKQGHSHLAPLKGQERQLSVEPVDKKIDFTTAPHQKLISVHPHRQLQSVESRNKINDMMPRVSPQAPLQRQMTSKEHLAPNDMTNKGGDVYSWKYYYKLSKQRQAAREQDPLEKGGLFSSAASEIASTGLQSSVSMKVLQPEPKRFMRHDLRITSQHESITPSQRLKTKKNAYSSISNVLGNARNASSNRNNMANPGLTRQVNSEALLQKSKLWEQRAARQQDEATRYREGRSLKEGGRLQRQIDGQMIGALHAKLHIMNQIQL